MQFAGARAQAPPVQQLWADIDSSSPAPSSDTMFSSCPANPSPAFWRWKVSATCFAVNGMAQMPPALIWCFISAALWQFSCLCWLLHWSDIPLQAERHREGGVIFCLSLRFQLFWSVAHILRGFCESPWCLLFLGFSPFRLWIPKSNYTWLQDQQ